MGKPLYKSTPAEKPVLPHGRTFPPIENERITEDEVWQTIERSKPGKAAGPDNISNELMKRAMLFTVKLWTALYNKCLEITNIPKIWRESTVKVVYKGKGSQNTPDSYRRIALECTPFKMLNNILLGKIHDRVMSVIPREQYGLIPGKSTTQAVGNVHPIYKRRLVKTEGTRICNIHRLQTIFRWGKQEQSTRETAPCSRRRKPDKVHSLHLTRKHDQNS